MTERRRSSGLFRAVPAALSLALLAAGCTVEPLVTIDHVMDPHMYRFDEKKLTASKLEKNMREIDEQYSEPRTIKKVELSLETAELSISSVNNYEALWRGARACCWLANNENLPREQREQYALKAYSMSRQARQRMSNRVEPWYYGALAVGAYIQLRHEAGNIPSARWLKDAKYLADMAVSIDETFDYAGPHRFLGKLIVEASGTLTHSVGRFEQGVRHLERAVELSPHFAENRLFLAEAYIEDENYDAARAEIEAVLASSVPPDHTVEHKKWMSDATALLSSLPPAGGEGASVDVSSFSIDEDAKS